MRSSRRLMVAIVAAWLLFAAACGGDGDEESVPAAPGEDVAAEQEEPDEPSPLDEFMGWADEGDDEDWEAMEREVQELVVACMAEQGFEYQPVYWSQMEFEDPMGSVEEEHGTLEYAQKYGYGMTMMFEWDLEHAQDMGPEDPNDAYVESLSDAEQEAYFRALHGEWPDIDPSLSDEEVEAILDDLEPTGCMEDAHREVYGDSWWDSPTMEEFGQLQDDLDRRVEADPRVIEARSGWVQCMAEHGHDFAAPHDAEESAWGRMNELWMSMTHPLGELSEAEIEAMSDEARMALESQPPDYDRDLLAQINAYEIEVAVADARCRQEHGGGDDQIEDQVRRELEAVLIEEHRELLEQVRDEMP